MKRTPEEQARWLSELPSHRLAFEDVEFLHRDELRPVRLQLELQKPELLQQEQGIVSTIVVFGSARTPSEGEGARYYEEARRFGDGVWIDILEERWDAAIRAAQENLQQDPDGKNAIEVAADAFFYAGRIDEALPLYERLLDLAPEGQPLPIFYFPLPATMRLALARREAGDEAGAQAAAQIVRQELAAGRAAGVVSFEQDLTDDA